MQIVHTVEDVRALVNDWHETGLRVAFVPTMGNLHAGHLQLVALAQRLADRVIASVYVNPLQFGENEDFDNYPRTLGEDSAALADAGTDALFAPSDADIYPEQQTERQAIQPPDALTDILCGEYRPGHFAGVATVIKRLFDIVQPDIAVFGEKDYQQLLVIRWLVKTCELPLEIIGAPTVREADGLAMSSRNRYLTEDQRAVATSIYTSLCQARDRIRQGEQDFRQVETGLGQQLEAAGLRPEYVSVRRKQDLALPEAENDELIILVAAHLGVARLIDNIMI